MKEISIYDVLGKKIKSSVNLATAEIDVDVSDLSKGIYIVEITSNTDTKNTKKLIVQ